LLNYAAAAYTFGEHSAGGTPESTRRISRSDLVSFHKTNYKPGDSALIFTGDITSAEAFSLARLFFGGWEAGETKKISEDEREPMLSARPPTVNRILVVDLPKSGQAAVGFANRLKAGRIGNRSDYFAALVLNSILGGGYSARLNQEIRLKRGLSYGARSSFSWRRADSNFLAVAQTKNESAGQVAELIRIEIEKLINDDTSLAELTPRKAVVTGGFGRSLQTNNGLAGQLRNLYAFGLTADELGSFMNDVKSVSSSKIKDFSGNNLSGGDIIIVGDSSLFLDDLKKRFPDHGVDVIKSDRLDLNKKSLKRR
jgi:zinc protease